MKLLNLVSLDTPLAAGQRLIRVGNSYIPVGVGGTIPVTNSVMHYALMPLAASDRVGAVAVYTGLTGEYKNGCTYVCVQTEDGYEWQNITPVSLVSNAITFTDAMLEASLSNVGKVVLFTGYTIDNTYVHGHLYQCVFRDNVYVWLDTGTSQGNAITLQLCNGLGYTASEGQHNFSWADPLDVAFGSIVFALWDTTVLVKKLGDLYPANAGDGVIVASTSKAHGTRDQYRRFYATDTLSGNAKYKLFSRTVAGVWNNLDANVYSTATGPSWAMVRDSVRAGTAAVDYPVGTVFMVDHGDYVHVDGTGLWMRVIGHDICEPLDPSLEHSMLLDCVDSLFLLAFDNILAQYALTADAVVKADHTYYALVDGAYTKLVAGTDYQLGDAVPNGSWYEKNALGTTNNRWDLSNARQWLNSDGAANAWFEQQNPWDVCSGSLAKRNGFLYNIDPDFLSIVAPVKNRVAVPSARGGGFIETTDRFFFLSNALAGLGANNGIMLGAASLYYASSALRVKMKWDGSQAVNWWLRSPGVGGTDGVYYVTASGALGYNLATNSYGFSPACVIA